MLRRTLSTAVLLALTASATAAAQSAESATNAAAAPAARVDVAPADSATALAFGQKVSGWLWSAEVDSLWAVLDDESRTTLQSPDNIADQVLNFVGRFGAETTVVREELVRQGENYRYTRVVHLEASEEPWTLVWTLAPELEVMHLDLQPGS